MRWLIRGAIGIVVVVVLVAVGLIVLVSAADLTGFRNEIAAAIEAETGRKVTIRGRIDKKVLTLSPTAVVHDVSFANAKWGTRPEMVRAKRVEATLALLPLLSGEIRVKRFTLIGADVLLETDAKGRGNWIFWPEEKRKAIAAKRAASGEPPSVQNVSIRDSIFRFYDGRSKLLSTVRIDEVTATARSFDSAVRLRTKGEYNGMPVASEGTLGALLHFLRGSKDFPVKLHVRFGKSELRLAVTADMSGALPSIVGVASSKRLDIDEISAAAARGRQAKPTGRKRAGLFPRDELPLGILGLFNANLDVKLDALVAGKQRLRNVKAKFRLINGDMKVTNLDAQLTNGRVQGNVHLDLRTAKPAMAARLRASRISLAQVTQAAAGRPILTSVATATINVTGEGRSIYDMVSTFKGPVVAYVGGGPIHSSLFQIASTDLLSLVGLHKAGFRVVCGVFAFNFNKGVGYSRNLVLDTTRLTLYGKGALNLPREYMNFHVVPSGKGVSLTRIAGLLPINVRGPLSRPSVKPDPKGVPKELLQGVLGLAELPGDIAGTLFGRSASKGRRVGCGARKASNEGILKKPGELLKKPGNLLKKLNPFR